MSNIETALARVAQNAAIKTAELAGTTDIEPLILVGTEMLHSDEDRQSNADCYADMAIAAPEMAEIAVAARRGALKIDAPVATDCTHGAERPAQLENLQDAVSAEVAALFRKHPVLHHAQPLQPITANSG